MVWFPSQILSFFPDPDFLLYFCPEPELHPFTSSYFLSYFFNWQVERDGMNFPYPAESEHPVQLITLL
jgi:hypothetical protein